MTEDELDQMQRELKYYYSAISTPMRISINSLMNWIDEVEIFNRLEINNKYQRSLVWGLEKKQNYIIFLLRGGKCPISVNMYPYESGKGFELVDGQQRLNAILEFSRGEFDVYLNGNKLIIPKGYFKKMEFEYHRLEFKTELEVVDFYITINSTTSVHSANDLSKAIEYKNELESED